MYAHLNEQIKTSVNVQYDNVKARVYIYIYIEERIKMEQ